MFKALSVCVSVLHLHVNTKRESYVDSKVIAKNNSISFEKTIISKIYKHI